MDILTGFFYLASQIKMIEKILLWKKELKNWKNESPQDIRISVKKGIFLLENHLIYSDFL